MTEDVTREIYLICNLRFSAHFCQLFVLGDLLWNIIEWGVIH